jgi:uncharacterized protein DUF11
MRMILLSGLAATVAALALSSAALSAPARSACTPGQDCGLADLQLTGGLNEGFSKIGDSLVWQLTANDYNTYPILNVGVDVTLPAGTQLVSAVTDRGAGCAATSPTTLHCSLDWLSKDVQFAHVTITTTVNAVGAHTLTATAGYSSPSGPVADPIPSNNTVSLTSVTPAPPVLPVIAAGVPSHAVTAGKTVTVTFNVTRSDNQQPMTDGTLTVASTLGTASIVNTSVFANGAAQVTVTIPKKKVKGKKLFVSITVTSTTNSVASKSAKFTVH